MNGRLSTWLTHPWLTIRVQIALGAIFVAAALPKVLDPPSFAHAVYNYRLLPGAFVNVAALWMPWVELMAGLGLILGIWRRTAAVLIGLLLALFVVAIGFNLLRDNAVICGCFDPAAAAKSHDELIDEMRIVVVRDLGMLLMVGQILWATARERLAERAPATASLPASA